MARRTREQLRSHYEVEKELARRLLHSTREERPALLASLYRELFERVPDHPRLTRRETPENSRRSVEARMRLLRPHLRPETRFLEFAPGDCRLAYEVCKTAASVIAVDISDQRHPGEEVPANFTLVLYDGFELKIPDAAADLVFSYQFLEHLHPEDFQPHLELAHRLLRPGGVYIFDTPHRFSGPHDISGYFSSVPEGFHFKEWTYREMREALARAGFTRFAFHRRGRLRQSPLALRLTLTGEILAGLLPFSLRRKISRRFLQSVSIAAYKSEGGGPC